MDEILIALVVSGILAIGVGYVWLFLAAFQVSSEWGFGCMLVPGVSIVFALYKPDRAIKPLLVLLVGLLLSVSPFWLN
ncbi:MAG: hypothetical protein KTR15_05315 [Phycisphaeraceae bacterium]|nr:hypothetical protein [Phycisphaeraceae bacterium]